jgi:hypothetical protein
MRIAKIVTKAGREIFGEVLRVGPVRFDQRRGWVLLSAPLDVPRRKRDVLWVHPTEVSFIWIREFRFA